ncbi:MAG: hypothetical protein WBI14_00950 [Anaerolineaceae bacterium]
MSLPATFPSLYIVFEKLKPVEVKPPDMLAELVERHFKKVMRREPERQFTRAELIHETEKLIGKVGKRSLAHAFALLGKDEAVKVELGEQNRKLYGLAMPVKAFYDSILEEEGELAAVDMLSKKLSVDAPLLLLEEQFERRDERKKSTSKLDEIIKKLRDGD